MGQGPSAPTGRRPQFEDPALYADDRGAGPGLQQSQAFDNARLQSSNLATTPQAAPSSSRTTAPASEAPQTGSSGSPSTAPQAGAAAAITSSAAAPAAGSSSTTAAGAGAAPANPSAGTTAAAPQPRSSHKSTTLIPSWSRSMSSQALQLECQKVNQPQRTASARDIYGVLDLEVMKFVAYCGGVTIRLRIDELAHGPVDNVTWGLASTRACPALVNSAQNNPSTASTSGSGSAAAASSSAAAGEGASSSTSCSTPTDKGKSPAAAARPGSSSSASGAKQGAPVTGVPVDSTSRKPLYMICSTSTHRQISSGDLLTIELAPREDKQPVIMATLKLNDSVLLQSSLPCSTISSLQMFPFVTVMPGMHVSLHEAVTPSPLFTWYSPTSVGAAETQLVELDTCVKYHTSAATPATLHNGYGLNVELQGSTVFRTGRHRWTVQLDNYSPHPTNIYVGVCNSTLDQGPVTNTSSILSNFSGPLRPIAGTSSNAAAAAAAGPSTSAGGAGAASSSGAGPSTSSAGGSAAVVPAAAAAAPRQPSKWGAWIKLPGTNAANNSMPANPNVPPPAREGFVHAVESTSAHCFITVDLDLNAGYVRFFRNGHLIVSAFTAVTGPISPVISFVQAPSLNCQAGLVNLTKLRQLDLAWCSERCSGDLRLAATSVSKVSEVYGDYSTVLANQGFISGVHLWMVKINNLSEPDSIFIGVCRGCMPLDQDPQDLRDRTYYLSNGVIRVGGRRVATNAANFTKGDVVTVVLDADQGEIVFFRNGMEQGRARGIRGRLYPFVSCDSEGDQITLLGSYTVLLNRIPRNLADMEWDTMNHGSDIELSSNCLTATKTASNKPSTVCGTILYTGTGTHEFHVILDTLGPDGVWVGVAPGNIDPNLCVGDKGCGWALHSDGDRRFDGKEEEFTQPFKNGDVLTVSVNLGSGSVCFARNGVSLGEAFTGVTGPLVSAVTLASEETKVTIQNRPTVLNTGEYTGELRWDEARAGKDLHVIDGLTVTKMSNEGGDYATVLGTLCMASGQHSWNVYINHVEDSNLFIGVTVGGHDLNADPQEMKHRTYYLSNGTIRVAGKLITRCAEPYAEGDLITVQLDMEVRRIAFLKNGVLQGAGDGLPEEVWPYVSLDNIMDSITLHSSSMFIDLAHSLRWNPQKASKNCLISPDGHAASLKPATSAAAAAAALSAGGAPVVVEETSGQATVLGLREYAKTEVHSWIVRFEQSAALSPANFLVGVAPPTMELHRSLGEDGCGIGLDYFGYFYVNGRYFHASNLAQWVSVAKPVRGSTAKHKGKAAPIFTFVEGKCEVIVTLDLKEGTLKFSHGGRTIGTIAGVKGPLHAAVTLTSSKQAASLAPGPIGKAEHTNEELVNVLKAKGCSFSPKLEAALLLIPRDLYVPRDRHREAFRDQKVTVRMSDGSTMTLPPPSFVGMALEKLGLGPGVSFLDVGCGTGYVTTLAACLLGPSGLVHGIECVSSRLESARANVKQLKERLSSIAIRSDSLLQEPLRAIGSVELSLSNVLIPECTDGMTYDAIYCDASLSEEDLPTFLSLLKPGGRMVVIIDEEALLVTRSADPHDFNREVITHVSGDYGELEDPTPWEVQEAILRIKDRERRRGVENARSEMASLRSFEYAEMQQRVTAAMQRISELEGLVARAGHAAMAAGMNEGGGVVGGAPGLVLSGMGMGMGMGGLNMSMRSPLRDSLRSPAAARVAGMDDVRVVVKDKSRRSLGLKVSPRSGGRAGSPALEGEDLKDKYTGDASLTGSSLSRSRDHELSDQAGDGLDGGLGTAHVSMPQTAFEDLIDAMSVQTFSVEQVEAMIRGATAAVVESREVFQGTFKGVKVRVWKVPINHSVSYLELKRAYSKYCIAHPNITAVLGVCIQHPDMPPTPATARGGIAAAIGSLSIRDSSDDTVAASAAAASAVLAMGAPPMTPSASPLRPQLQGMGSFESMQREHTLWVVEEWFGEESLHARLERGLLSWQQVLKISTDLCKALAFLQDLKAGAAASPSGTDGAQTPGGDNGEYYDAPPSPSPFGGNNAAASAPAVLSPYALKTLVMPANVQVDAQATKISMLPILLNHLESVVCEPSLPPVTPFHADMAYTDPNALYADDDNAVPSFYAFGVVLLQLVTEQGALGLLSAVKEALSNSTLLNLVPRLPASAEMAAWAEELAALAIRCTQMGGVGSLESEALPVLHGLAGRLSSLGSSAMSWEQVEEMLMLPLQPRMHAGGESGSGGSNTRRWVRQDFRMRRKMFLAEVAKLAVEGPVHKLEIRRNRCFKDSVAVFSGKGHAVWRQPLKVTFIGEAGMDSGGVTREWFSTLSSAISRGSPELFWTAGPQKNQLYINPLSSSPSHLKKFAFVGLFMAKAILETAARGKELGPITLNLSFCEPFWKLLLGVPLSLMDLQQLDPTEFRSLMSILNVDIDGLIFETFTWAFQHSHSQQGGAAASGAAPLPPHAAFAAMPLPTEASEVSTPTAAGITNPSAAASPFACDVEDSAANSIALKPGGKHIKVTNHNKREYVLLKAHKMLVGAVEAQMSAIIDAFHSVLPRDLLDKYQFSSLEMQLLVCGEQRIDIQDLKRNCKYEDGYSGKEETLAWFWDVVEAFDDEQRRQLLQFWSGSDGMPAEGFGAMDPAFHIVAVERLYDPNDTTARLPAAHTCFRQLDLPRYRSRDELKDKLLCAITIGQGYMALS